MITVEYGLAAAKPCEATRCSAILQRDQATGSAILISVTRLHVRRIFRCVKGVFVGQTCQVRMGQTR